MLKGLLSVVRSRCLPTSIKLQSRGSSQVFSTCNQLLQICRNPDVISLADGLRHVPRNLHYDESQWGPAMWTVSGHERKNWIWKFILPRYVTLLSDELE